MSASDRTIVHECTCCHRRFTIEEWRALTLVGYMGDVERLELRNCNCRLSGMQTTLAIKVDAKGDPV